MTFEEWWSKNRTDDPVWCPRKASARVVWNAAQEAMRERWVGIVEKIAESRQGAVQAALWGLAEMMEKNIEHVSVRLNRARGGTL